MASKNNSVNVQLDDDTYNAVVREADAQDRTVPRQVARILRQWAKDVDATPAAVQEANPGF